MDLTIRASEDDDISAMAAIRAQEWETEAFWKERIGRYMHGEHSPQKALAARAAFVAVREGVVAGFVAGHRTRRYDCDGELQWINVAMAHRGRGIAGQLLLAIAPWFVSQKALRICVNVDPKNAAARALYANYGAQPLNPHWMVWQDVRVLERKNPAAGE